MNNVATARRQKETAAGCASIRAKERTGERERNGESDDKSGERVEAEGGFSERCARGRRLLLLSLFEQTRSFTSATRRESDIMPLMSASEDCATSQTSFCSIFFFS